MKKLLSVVILILLTALPVQAEPLRIVTDIAPVRALVRAVAGDQVTVAVLVGAGAEPHEFVLRPSQARELQQADAVFWVGPTLAHWLEKTLTNLGGEVPQLALETVAGTRRLPMRWQSGAMDPHFWLDPQNAALWVGEIARVLAKVDPVNAAQYQENAAAALGRIAQAESDAARVLAPLAKQPYLVFHDAYQYFETRFGLSPLGTVTTAEGVAPSAAAIAKARDLLQGADARCLLYVPDANQKLIAAVTETAPVRLVSLDPLGWDVQGGDFTYAQLLAHLVDGYAGCLGR